jgi:hypothetical protein
MSATIVKIKNWRPKTPPHPNVAVSPCKPSPWTNAPWQPQPNTRVLIRTTSRATMVDPAKTAHSGTQRSIFTAGCDSRRTTGFCTFAPELESTQIFSRLQTEKPRKPL